MAFDVLLMSTICGRVYFFLLQEPATTETFSGRFPRGFCDVSARFRWGSGKVSARFQHGFGEVLARLRCSHGEPIFQFNLNINSDNNSRNFITKSDRGIDVGLIFNKDVFKVKNSNSHDVFITGNNSSKRRNTRDQLVVSGLLDGELIHIIVNHWPSRGADETKRIAAAEVNNSIIDSLRNIHNNPKIITMGDFNDDPFDKSIKKVLGAKKEIKEVGKNDLYNPFEKILVEKGIGTNAYRDKWQLFDQIILSKEFLKKDYKDYQLYKAGVFNKSFLINKKGKFKGYPYRSFSYGTFTGGYSDHLPPYIFLLKEIK